MRKIFKLIKFPALIITMFVLISVSPMLASAARLDSHEGMMAQNASVVTARH